MAKLTDQQLGMFFADPNRDTSLLSDEELQRGVALLGGLERASADTAAASEQNKKDLEAGEIFGTGEGKSADPSEGYNVGLIGGGPIKADGRDVPIAGRDPFVSGKLDIPEGAFDRWKRQLQEQESGVFATPPEEPSIFDPTLPTKHWTPVNGEPQQRDFVQEAAIAPVAAAMVGVSLVRQTFSGADVKGGADLATGIINSWLQAAGYITTMSDPEGPSFLQIPPTRSLGDIADPRFGLIIRTMLATGDPGLSTAIALMAPKTPGGERFFELYDEDGNRREIDPTTEPHPTRGWIERNAVEARKLARWGKNMIGFAVGLVGNQGPVGIYPTPEQKMVRDLASTLFTSIGMSIRDMNDAALEGRIDEWTREHPGEAFDNATLIGLPGGFAARRIGLLPRTMAGPVNSMRLWKAYIGGGREAMFAVDASVDAARVLKKAVATEARMLTRAGDRGLPHSVVAPLVDESARIRQLPKHRQGVKGIRGQMIDQLELEAKSGNDLEKATELVLGEEQTAAARMADSTVSSVDDAPEMVNAVSNQLDAMDKVIDQSIEFGNLRSSPVGLDALERLKALRGRVAAQRDEVAKIVGAAEDHAQVLDEMKGPLTQTVDDLEELTGVSVASSGKGQRIGREGATLGTMLRTQAAKAVEVTKKGTGLIDDVLKRRASISKVKGAIPFVVGAGLVTYSALEPDSLSPSALAKGFGAVGLITAVPMAATRAARRQLLRQAARMMAPRAASRIGAENIGDPQAFKAAILRDKEIGREVALGIEMNPNFVATLRDEGLKFLKAQRTAALDGNPMLESLARSVQAGSSGIGSYEDVNRVLTRLLGDDEADLLFRLSAAVAKGEEPLGNLAAAMNLLDKVEASGGLGRLRRLIRSGSIKSAKDLEPLLGVTIENRFGGPAGAAAKRSISKRFALDTAALDDVFEILKGEKSYENGTLGSLRDQEFVRAIKGDQSAVVLDRAFWGDVSGQTAGTEEQYKFWAGMVRKWTEDANREELWKGLGLDGPMTARQFQQAFLAGARVNKGVGVRVYTEGSRPIHALMLQRLSEGKLPRGGHAWGSATDDRRAAEIGLTPGEVGRQAEEIVDRVLDGGGTTYHPYSGMSSDDWPGAAYSTGPDQSVTHRRGTRAEMVDQVEDYMAERGDTFFLNPEHFVTGFINDAGELELNVAMVAAQGSPNSASRLERWAGRHSRATGWDLELEKAREVVDPLSGSGVRPEIPTGPLGPDALLGDGPTRARARRLSTGRRLSKLDFEDAGGPAGEFAGREQASREAGEVTARQLAKMTTAALGAGIGAALLNEKKNELGVGMWPTGVVGGLVVAAGGWRFLTDPAVRKALADFTKMTTGGRGRKVLRVPDTALTNAGDMDKLVQAVIEPMLPESIMPSSARVWKEGLAIGGGAAAGFTLAVDNEVDLPNIPTALIGAAAMAATAWGLTRKVSPIWKREWKPRESFRRLFLEDGNADPIVAAKLRDTRRRMGGRLTEINDVSRDLAKLTPEEGELVTDYWSGNVNLAALPEKARQPAILGRLIFDEITLDLIDVGIAEGAMADTLMTNMGSYVPRLYYAIESAEANRVFQQAVTWAQQNNIPVAKLSDFDFLKKRKDLPQSIRDALGEIRDNPSYLLAKRGMISSMDVENMRLMNWLAASEYRLDDTLLPRKTPATVDEIKKFATDNGIPDHHTPAEQLAVYDAMEKTRRGGRDEARVFKGSGGQQFAEHGGKQYQKMPDDKKYGPLAGKFLEVDIADNELVKYDTASIAKLIHDRGLAVFKRSKVVLNPSTLMRNLYSNMILADMAGVSPARIGAVKGAVAGGVLGQAAGDDASDVGLGLLAGAVVGGVGARIAKLRGGVTYGTALTDFMGKGRHYVDSRRAGLFGGEWRGAEVAELLGGVEGMTPGKGGTALSRMNENLSNLLGRVESGKVGFESLERFHEASEQFFKLMVYSHARETLGKGIVDSVEYANRYIFDYREVPKMIQLTRKSVFGVPFITFSYKAIPRVIETATSANPKEAMRFWKYPMMLGAINEWQAREQGFIEPDQNTSLTPSGVVDTLGRVAASGLGVGDPHNFKRWLPGYAGGSQILLPKKDAFDRPIAMDLTFWLPWGDLGEVSTGTLGKQTAKMGIGYPRFLEPGNPWLHAGVAALTGRDAFTGYEVFQSGTPGGNIVDYGRYLTRMWAPALFTPAGFGYEKLRRAVTTDLAQDPFVPDIQTAVNSELLGIKGRPFDPRSSFEWRAAQAKKEVGKLAAQASRLGRKGAPRFRIDELERRAKAIVEGFTKVYGELPPENETLERSLTDNMEQRRQEFDEGSEATPFMRLLGIKASKGTESTEEEFPLKEAENILGRVSPK